MQGDFTQLATSLQLSDTLNNYLNKPHNKEIGSSFSTMSIASKESLTEDLTSLSQEIAAFKRHGDPPFLDIQSFAERIWRANLAYETAIAKLNQEKRTLTKQIDVIWGTFDTLIKPLWRVDDALVPLYDALADLRIRLEEIHMAKLDAIAASSSTLLAAADFDLGATQLLDAQSRLHLLETEYVVDGKFVPAGWVSGDPVPSGQAVVANLLAKCYRLVRMINEADPVVDKQLLPIQFKLENCLSSLRAFKNALSLGTQVDPLQLTSLQLHVDATASLLHDGKFLAADGVSVPKGQAVVRGMLEEAYDLIHDSLVALEVRDAERKKSGNRGENDEVVEMAGRVAVALDTLNASSRSRNAPANYDGGNDDDTEDEEQKLASDSGRGLLNSPTAIHTIGETLSDGYKVIKNQTATAITGATLSLASLVRAGLSSVGKAFESIEQIDPTLEPMHNRLVKLRIALLALRTEKDKIAIARIRDGDGDVWVFEENEEDLKRKSYSIRTHLAVLEEIDMDRDENGRFLNDEGGAPVQGQAQLKAILEECFILAYELL
ncbi:hypothetical protein HK100_005621 [Physocladia obscura]|uniref:Uncharacterized protein n=1 Tax=Physocladia obscura TaxID=109957 RepID=A0AAD5XKK9_9FUNG|nr:hypothetical protein HK100_005621 [Physocladia obscura]